MGHATPRFRRFHLPHQHQWLFERLVLRRDEPPESHSTHPPAELLSAAVFEPDEGLLWRSKQIRDTRATAPATCEQAQAQTMGGLAKRRFRPLRSLARVEAALDL